MTCPRCGRSATLFRRAAGERVCWAVCGKTIPRPAIASATLPARPTATRETTRPLYYRHDYPGIRVH